MVTLQIRVVIRVAIRAHCCAGRKLTKGTDREGESAHAIKGGEESARLGRKLTEGTDREGESVRANPYEQATEMFFILNHSSICPARDSSEDFLNTKGRDSRACLLTMTLHSLGFATELVATAALEQASSHTNMRFFTALRTIPSRCHHAAIGRNTIIRFTKPMHDSSVHRGARNSV